MVSSDELASAKHILESWGTSDINVKIYLYLLEHGPKSPKEVAAGCGIRPVVLEHILHDYNGYAYLGDDGLLHIPSLEDINSSRTKR